MAYKAKAYTLREESTESGIRYFISFKDGQGEHHELEVSEQLFFEFRQMERRNRNLLQWDERHREFSEVWDETLNRRALKLPKSIEEQMIEAERAELLCKAVDRLPEIQRRRFLLYYEYEFNFYQIGIVSSIQMIRQFIYISVVSPGGGRAFFDKSITVGFCRYAFCFMAATSFSRRFQQ
mgnify:FL=1